MAKRTPSYRAFCSLHQRRNHKNGTEYMKKKTLKVQNNRLHLQEVTTSCNLVDK